MSMRKNLGSLLCFLALAGFAISAYGQGRQFDDFTKHFRLNTLPTTPYGPAWADILVRPENFLACKGASIALCYYSGPGPVTPCTVEEGKGLANCTCYEIPSGLPYFVDINAILNLDVYLDTVKTCGTEWRKLSSCRFDASPGMRFHQQEQSHSGC